MDLVCKRLILLMLAGWVLLGPATGRALAASYQQALDAYDHQDYSRSYKKAMSLAREKKGTRRAKALILAAAAVLELDRERKAKVLFKKALDEDPDLGLPDVVRSRRAQRFFADVRDGRDTRAVATKVEKTPLAFDRLETYLPFGVNQLVQEKYVLGLTLGGIQALGVYFAYAKSVEADETDQTIQAVRQKAFQSGDDINPVFLDFVDENQAFAKKSRQLAQLSLALAAAAYGGSVLEAGFRPPSSTRVTDLLQPRYTLLAMQQDRTQFRLEILNPLLAIQGLQFSFDF
ncbi:MAG TPA: hypothetical protein VE954_25325 [Oligoflexus sp.]|uniref:hypothetical protein n=1 Tax=Oligoflexus sp. TaxID=1971216 RepID=UPI002D518BB0|nr:hypothetical protein [Oligoflexus sp.]HYX36442.1 hypothetical protein [Oligoflexus sp.]